MAVTGAIFNTLTYGGVNSADYGIYITGEAVYNAPKRAVTLVEVPGRNGDIEVDEGRFENIEVTYPAGMFGDDNTDFKTRLSNFRNAILSQRGYQRLTDSYHSDEYRLALYVEGLEVSPANQNIAGEFNLVFNCKPQRFLTSGETEVEGLMMTLTNPTLFDASPLIAVEGAGTIAIENSHYPDDGLGYVIDASHLADNTGEVILYESSDAPMSFIDIDDELFNATDVITVKLNQMSALFRPKRRTDTLEITSFTKLSGNLNSTGSTATVERNGDTCPVMVADINQTVEFEFGTGLTEMADIYRVTVVRTPQTGSPVSTQYKVKFSVKTNNSDQFVTSADLTSDSPTDSYINAPLEDTSDYRPFTLITGYSTVPVAGDPTYIDCDLGEVYKYDSQGKIVSLNRYVSLQSDLPVLAPGNNDISGYGDIDNLTVTPRWWRI